MKRVGLLVIGDELLAGHTQDTNTHWLAQRLQEMGIALRRVETITDDVADIEATVRRFLHDVPVDYVITSGGLGPTPDDRTMEGIARAVGVGLTADPKWVAWMRDRVAEGHRRGYFDAAEPNKGIQKMVYLPEGAAAMPNHVGTALGAIVEANGRTLFTLPGVPAEFKRMFDECVASRLEMGERKHVAELKLRTEESRFYELLAKLEDEHPAVSIGSYPHPGYIVIRATGPRDEAEAVIAEVRDAGAAYLDDGAAGPGDGA